MEPCRVLKTSGIYPRSCVFVGYQLQAAARWKRLDNIPRKGGDVLLNWRSLEHQLPAFLQSVPKLLKMVVVMLPSAWRAPVYGSTNLVITGGHDITSTLVESQAAVITGKPQ